MPYRPKLGFTLLELLAALAVLAVLASLSFRGLSSVLDGEAHVREQAKRWSDVGLLLGQLREDVSSAMEGRGFTLGPSTDADLIITRFADQPGAAPRRVGYRLREGRVEYLLWPQGMDSGPPAAAYAVLANVADMRFTALREDGTWMPVWPVGQPLPRAVSVDLALASGEHVTRLFALR
ncbi:MAG TPA: type II secretion system protein GspJ [Burkholderiales bacterium]